MQYSGRHSTLHIANHRIGTAFFNHHWLSWNYIVCEGTKEMANTYRQSRMSIVTPNSLGKGYPAGDYSYDG